ncbi:hypothetical protein B0H63DRAFT_175230 [Podospora didyma]|uniref:Uncharacterized protein n=1 Tax=Podospora didyma TaxID=330526 RepID=A0AAE0NNT8_9PEZI|nr:hypothetical protein B0H63DRAFT_175230 [Podospora didyma]
MDQPDTGFELVKWLAVGREINKPTVRFKCCETFFLPFLLPFLFVFFFFLLLFILSCAMTRPKRTAPLIFIYFIYIYIFNGLAGGGGCGSGGLPVINVHVGRRVPTCLARFYTLNYLYQRNAR